MNRQTTPLNKKTTVAITAANEQTDLNSSIWAINWFDLKRSKLYTFYNVMVFPHVKKVGGQAHFKGYIKEKLEGNSDFDRQMLLIVKYPTAGAFLKMLTNKLFLLKSVLRMKSVSRFIFGFTKRIGDQPAPPAKPARYIGKNFYLAHLFQSEKISEDDLLLLKPLFSQYNLVNYFSGLKAATLSRLDEGDKEQMQPFFVDGLFVLEGSDRASFEMLLKDPIYEAFKSKCTENNVYLVKRVI